MHYKLLLMLQLLFLEYHLNKIIGIQIRIGNKANKQEIVYIVINPLWLNLFINYVKPAAAGLARCNWNKGQRQTYINDYASNLPLNVQHLSLNFCNNRKAF